MRDSLNFDFCRNFDSDFLENEAEMVSLLCRAKSRYLVTNMGPGNGESPSSLEKTMLPVPPPLPVHLNARFYQRGLSTSGSKHRGHCCSSNSTNESMDRLFDEAYRADVSILTDDGGVIYAHASILGNASPVFRSMLKQQKGRTRGKRPRSISILGVRPTAARIFIRFLYSSCYEEEEMKEFAMPLLVLSHAYVVPQLKQVCESWLEQRLLSIENAMDIFQLSLLCDAPRLSLVCHRFILKNFKSVSATEGWNAMKESHPVLEKEIRTSIIEEDFRQKERTRKANERKMYEQLYDAMEALVHICRDGCRTIGPFNKTLRDDCEPCNYTACKGLEALVRHFAGCKLRGPGGCVHCKRMWQILELHSRLCVDSDACGVPLCRNFRQRRRKQNKKEEMRWRILVKKIVRSKSINGSPFFVLEST